MSTVPAVDSNYFLTEEIYSQRAVQRPIKHTTSFWRCYNVVWTSITLLQRLNDVVCLPGLYGA